MSKKELEPVELIDITIKAFAHGALIFEKSYRNIQYTLDYDDQLTEIQITDSLGKTKTQSFFNVAVIVTED
jgi:hypothetical protein